MNEDALDRHVWERVDAFVRASPERPTETQLHAIAAHAERGGLAGMEKLIAHRNAQNRRNEAALASDKGTTKPRHPGFWRLLEAEAQHIRGLAGDGVDLDLTSRLFTSRLAIEVRFEAALTDARGRDSGGRGRQPAAPSQHDRSGPRQRRGHGRRQKGERR